MTRPFFILTVLASLLNGCSKDQAADEAGTKSPPAKKSASVAIKIGINSINDILRSIMLSKANDHAGMKQDVRINAAGY